MSCASRLLARVFLTTLVLAPSIAPSGACAQEAACIADQLVLRSKVTALKGVEELPAIKVSHQSPGLTVAQFKGFSGGQPARITLCPDEQQAPPAGCRAMVRAAKRAGPRLRYRAHHVECGSDFVLKASAAPNDGWFSSLWALHQSSDIDIDAVEAWDRSTGSASTVVAIIDTGVLYSHPDLNANIWRNPYEVAGNGVDDDGNGYVDDIYGINAETNAATPGNPIDQNGHGTHVAGTIGAVGNNGSGVAGVNWNIKMIAARFLDATGSGSTAGAIRAIDYITRLKTQQGIKVVLSNNSWGGGGYSSPLLSAITAARNAGILFVAAAGNESNNNDALPSYPASYNVDNIISVASIESDGTLSGFSNYGATSVDLGAPGGGILSTYLGNGYAWMSGTSMATPHVSGAIALLSSFRPSLSAQQLSALTLSSVAALSSLAGISVTGGLLNVNSMLAAVATTPTATASATATLASTSTPTRAPTSTPVVAPTPSAPTPTPIATVLPTAAPSVTATPFYTVTSSPIRTSTPFYTPSATQTPVVGTIESFEGAYPPAGAWSVGTLWQVPNDQYFYTPFGQRSALGGYIGQSYNTTSRLTRTVNLESGGEVSFWWAVSSELNYDFLFFCVDNVQCNKDSASHRISGFVNWTRVSVWVPAGIHSLTWGVQGDESVYEGYDLGLIDYLSIPKELSATPTPAPTLTATATPTVSSTPSPTATSTRTPIPVATPTMAATSTALPTASPVFVPSNTPTRTATPTWTPSRTPTQIATAAATTTPTQALTGTPTRTPTRIPTATRTATPTRTPTLRTPPRNRRASSRLHGASAWARAQTARERSR